MKKSLTKSIQIPQCSFANVVPVSVPPLAAVLSDAKSALFRSVRADWQGGARGDDGSRAAPVVRPEGPA